MVVLSHVPPPLPDFEAAVTKNHEMNERTSETRIAKHSTRLVFPRSFSTPAPPVPRGAALSCPLAGEHTLVAPAGTPSHKYHLSHHSAGRLCFRTHIRVGSCSILPCRLDRTPGARPARSRHLQPTALPRQVQAAGLHLHARPWDVVRA